jgi:hypothetical protein
MQESRNKAIGSFERRLLIQLALSLCLENVSVATVRKHATKAQQLPRLTVRNLTSALYLLAVAICPYVSAPTSASQPATSGFPSPNPV